MKLEYAVTCVAGRIRGVNEDNYYLNGIWKEREKIDSRQKGCAENSAALFAICDGLGGEGNGDFASYDAVCQLDRYKETFLDQYKMYLMNENQRMTELQKKSGTGMACTFAGVFMDEDGMTAINLGDSRIYLISDSKIEQLSEDHSEFAVMVRYGVFKEDEYYTNPARNRLTRSIGCIVTDEIEPHVVQRGISKSDIILLCSDGLCGSVKNDEILNVIMEGGGCKEIAEKLVEKAIERKSDDNITAIVIRVL